MSAPLLAGDAPAGWGYHRWAARAPGQLIAVSGQFNEDWERDAADLADAAGVGLLSIRVAGTEALIGPVRAPTAGVGPNHASTAGDGSNPAGCTGCAHTRDKAADPIGAAGHRLGALVEIYLDVLASVPLTAGELVAVGADGTIRRHRVPRTHRCPICGSGEPRATLPPAPITLTRRPTDAVLPTRGAAPFGLDPTRMRRELADARYGPVIRIRRKGRAPFAMTEVNLLGGQYPGYGRGRTFRTADAVAILEAYERAANTPQDAEIVERASRDELGTLAMDPATLGHYTARQLAAPDCRIQAYRSDRPIDWVWSHRLRDGAPLLVPAEVGFYRYAYPPDPTTGDVRRASFEESSSGSALGGSYEEAALHALIELAERDAFLLAWHQAAPRPHIDPATIDDPECRMLIDLITGRGYQLHLLAATADLGIPVVWALAVHRELLFPATFSTAGASPDPVEAVRSALWELGQLVAAGQELDEVAAQSVAGQPWKVFQLEDHIRFNALPENAPRVQRVLGGPAVSLTEAFPGWPRRFIEPAGADVTGALAYVASLYGAAGLPEILVVDQSSAEHRAAGLSAVKAVVPGIVPMCFGHANQRLAGLPRLAAAMRAAGGAPPDDANIPLDPHPFP